MINVKKWLVALMAVAMVFSFAGFAGVGVSADDAAPTDPAYVTGWTVDRAESGTTQYADLVKAYAAAKDGDFIYPSEHAVTSKEVLVASEQKKVTINTTEIDFQGKITVTAEGYCLGEKQKGIYTIDKHDVTNVVFSWDFNNVRAKVVESCDNCGSKLALNADGTPVQLEKDKGITVVGAVDCTKDQTITYTATYTSKYQTSKDWTETIERNEKATGHTYGYVQGSLKWVMGTDGKVTKDANGNPVATAKVNCAKANDIAEADYVTVTPKIKKTEVKQVATCAQYGEATYSFEIPVSQLPSDATNTEAIPVTKLVDNKPVDITLTNQTEKIECEAGEPMELEYAFFNKEKQETEWDADINKADDENGTVTYRVKYKCKHFGEKDTNNEVHENYVYGEAKTLAPKANPVITKGTGSDDFCYTTTYSYDKIHFIWMTTASSQSAKDLQAADKTVVTKTHTLDTNESWEIVTPATCGKPGEINFKCKDCGRDIQKDTNDPRVQPTGKHTFIQENGADKIFTKAATCTDLGYTYKVCETCEKDKVVLDGAKTGKDFGSVIVSEIPATNHDYVVVKSTDVEWSADGSVMTDKSEKIDPAAKITCVATVACKNEGITVATPVKITYYSWAYDPKVDTIKEDDTHKYDAISLDTATTNCTAYDKLTYTVKDLKDLNGKPVTITVGSKNIGKHTEDHKLNFSVDGKNATLTVQCMEPKCVDHQPVDVKICDVTSAFNADGSIKYTATCEGYTLTDNTKDVFDLREATITTNKVVDVDEVVAANALTDAAAKKDALIKALGLSVKVNGVELDKDVYTVDAAKAAAESKEATVTITPNADTKIKTTIVGEKTSDKFEAKKFAEFKKSDFVLTIDELKESQYGFADTFVYDGEDHDVVWAFKDAKLAEGATIKYAIVPSDYYDTPDDDEFEYDEFSESDVIDCKIWAMVTKDEYKPFKYCIVDDFEIYPLNVYVFIDNAKCKKGDVPNIKYFVGDENHKAIDVDEETLDIQITTASGETLTGLKAGTYVLKALSDNDNLIVYTRGGLNYADAPILEVVADMSGAGADKDAADSVMDKINALNESSTDADVAAARAAYDGLTDAQKKLVSSEALQKLQAAETAIDEKAAAAVTESLKGINESTPEAEAAAAVNAYNALTPAQKALVQKDAAAVTNLQLASKISGVPIAGEKKAGKITIKNKAKAKVKRGKALKVKYTKVGDGKVTVKISGNKKVKKFFKVKGTKIKVAKKAKKGKYKVKVTVSMAETANFTAAKKTKTIKVTVK